MRYRREKVGGVWGGGFVQWKKKGHLVAGKIKTQELLKLSMENIGLSIPVQSITLNQNGVGF